MSHGLRRKSKSKPIFPKITKSQSSTFSSMFHIRNQYLGLDPLKVMSYSNEDLGRTPERAKS